LYDDENFQITEYIRSRELTVEDYKVQGKRVQVAACIAKFNKIVPENGQSLTTENGQILTAENGQNSEILTAGNPEISLNSEPLLLYLLKDKKNYLETLERKLAADKFSVQEMESLQLPLSLISDSETKYLTEMFKSEPLGWDLRFSHNDLFYANVLLDFDREDLVLIDYEYSCMNPFMWDLGHMVNEATLSYSRTLYDWPYYKYDESLFPTDTQLGEILKAYWLFDTFDETVLDSKIF
jgi:thiamine kinase-like enzyme